tara:strand:+ start:29 stop:2527 length:2499 start_codon:yes stop_codon:yes gene_type:complete
MKDKKYVLMEKEPYVYELNTYNKHDAKDNIDVIEQSLNDTKISLSKYLQDVDTLYDNADEDGLESSFKSFQLLQNNLMNELQVNTSKVLTNKANAVPLKVNRNRNEMVSVEKVTKPRKNFELGNLTTRLVASNNDRDNLHFSNKEENKIVLTIGNNNSDPLISVGSVIKVESTTNYNGFFQCKDVLHKYKSGFDDGVYEFYAAGLRHKADEDHSSNAEVIVYNNALEEQMVAISATQIKPHIVNTSAITSVSASGLTSLKLECLTDGEITVTASSGTSLSASSFPANAIVKLEGAQTPEYNSLFKVKTAGTGTVVVLYGGSSDTFKANHLATETSLSDQPYITMSKMNHALNNSASSSIPIVVTGSQGTVQEDGSDSVTITKTNSDATITLTSNNSTPYSATVGDVVEVSGSASFDGFYTVYATVTGAAAIVLNAGSNTGTATAGGDATADILLYPMASAVTYTAEASASASVGVSQDLSKSMTLGTATDIEPASGNLTFTETNGIIKVVASAADFASTIAGGDVVQISGTTNFNGYFMAVADATVASRTVYLYLGDSNFSYSSETVAVASTTFVKYTPATGLYNSISTNLDVNKQFYLGSASATCSADDEADGFLLFQNRDQELIKMTVGMYLNSPNIAVGTIVEIKNTANFNGLWAVKSVDTIHSSTVHGVYTLIAPGLENIPLEKHYSDASISMYASNIEQQDPMYNKMAGTKHFSVKLSNCNKHVAFYVPGLSIYTDDAGLIEVLYAEKENNLDVVCTPADTITKHRISGKSALPSSLEELKEMYLQISGNGKDLDGINPNKDIVNLINNLEITSKGLASIKNAPYLY